MEPLIVAAALIIVIALYFKNNPLRHGRKFMIRRFINWFPLGMTYAFLYMGRYNLNVSKNALGSMMSIENFGIIFGAGTLTYGLSFLINGPLVDKWGGKRGIIIASLGSCLANVAMGVVTYLFLAGQIHWNLTVTYSALYAINMFFQSYGAVSIIKVKAYWFHVRERGVFGAIFGTLISLGVYFAFDWGQALVEASKLQNSGQLNWFQNAVRVAFAVDIGTTDATWIVFFVPAVLLVFWALVDMWLLKDTPSDCNFEDFDTHDASSGEMERDFTIKELLHRIFTNPIMMTIAFVEFTSGVLRNGIMQWYFIFAKEVPQPGAEFFHKNWGLLLCLAGICGGFLAGFISDKIFHSRRGPASAIMCGFMLILTLIMSATLFSSPVTVGACAVLMSLGVIGVHSLMSGTASADFGGRKATATASGIVDGFVYLGSGLQSICLGFLVPHNWLYWPLFLIPFAMMGIYFAVKMWNQLPEATKRYIATVEKVTVTVTTKTTHVVKHELP